MKFLSAKSNTHTFNRFFAVAVAILLSHTIFAQPQQTEAEKMLNGTPKATSTTTKAQKTPPKGTKQTRRTARGTPRQPDNGGTAGIKRRSRVTFYTGSSDVELLLDGNAIGMSGKDTRLIAVVDDGEHKLTAKKDGRDLNFTKVVNISTKETVFDIADALNRVISQLPAEKTQPETIPDKNQNNNKVVDGEAILEAYKDPQRTNSITVSDWEAVYKQSMAQMLSGNTKNDIEALASFAKGQIMLGAGNKNESIAAFSAATVFLPNSGLTHYGLGLAQHMAGRTADAMVEYQKAIRLEDKFALPYKRMGDLLSAQGKNKEAAVYYQKAKSLGDNSPEVSLGIASSQLKNKNCTEAIKELQVLETESPSAGVFMALGECYLQQNKAFSAIEYFKKSIDLDSNAPLAHFKLGKTYFDEKEYDKAKESLERALSLDISGKVINRKEVQEYIEKSRKRIK